MAILSFCLYVVVFFSYLDAILSVPGTGRHIERTTHFLSRIQQGVVNLIQLREISKYMLQMIDTVEQRQRVAK